MPVREFTTTIDVDAPVARAWRVLVDFAAYPRWCPTHREIRGEAALGETLRIRLAREPGSDATFGVSAAVRTLEAERELAYGGGFPGAAWIFDVHHAFRLEALGPDCCRLTNYERFSGVLVAVVGGAIARRVGKGYVAFNAAFRDRCEAESDGEPGQ